jgi:capsid portal protein
MVNQSTILPQCIDAYKRNITGFGYEIVYNDNCDLAEETEEMKAEYSKLQRAIDLMTIDNSFKDTLLKLLTQGKHLVLVI